MAELKTIEASAAQPYTEGVAGTDSAYVSKVTLPNGNTAYIKDALARQTIANIKEAIDGGTHFLGVTTTALTDGATTNPVTIGEDSVTAQRGDFVIVQKAGNAEPYIEYIWTGSVWTELGSTGSLKALAYKDSASTSYTPAGTVTVDYTPEGSVTIPEIVPAGTVSVDYTPEGSVTIPEIVPAGTVSKPDITVTTETAAAFGYVSAASYSDATETLTLSMATISDMVTGATAALDAAPTFTGTTIAATSVDLDGTAAATNIATFAGTTIAATSVDLDGTAAATNIATFAGTTVTITVS